MGGREEGDKNKRSYANLLTDAISVGNQIRAGLNRHRTQNHIRVNLMCMALPSAFLLSVPSVFILCFVLFFLTDLENSLQNILFPDQRQFFTRGKFQGPDVTVSP